MTWREMCRLWLTAEHPDQEERDRMIDAFLTAIYILAREAIVSNIDGRRNEAQALKAAYHEIEKLVEKIEEKSTQQE